MPEVTVSMHLPKPTQYLVRDTGRHSKVFKNGEIVFHHIIHGDHEKAYEKIMSGCKTNAVKMLYRMGVVSCMAHETGNENHMRQLVEFINYVYGVHVI